MSNASTDDNLLGYICLYRGQRVEVRAATTLAAQQAAHAQLQNKAGRRRVKRHEISVHLAEESDGTPVVHRPDF